MAAQPIKVSVSDTRERKRRQRELILAAVGFLLIAVLTWVELKYLGVNSYLFLGLFNFNFILLIIVLFVVGRNGVKLLLERRRNVLGSKLRTRLVLAFISLSLVPTLLMFVVSVKFVQTSVDYWFKSKVEDSMERALDVGQAFYASAQERLGRRGGNIIEDIRTKGYAWGGKTMTAHLNQKYGEYDLRLLGVVTPEGKEQNWHMAEEFVQAWQDVKAKINWESLEKQPRFWSSIWTGPTADFIVGVLPVDEAKTGFLVLGESIGTGLMFKLDRIVRGVDEYKQLKSLKHPLKLTLYFILLVLTMLILLGSMWFGFRLAKELSAPIQALAAGTERIASGDLTVRLEDTSTDEMGLLVSSFNKMVQDLAISRARLNESHQKLASRNAELDRHGRYVEAIIDNIAAGVISLDGEGQISTVNKAAAEILGVQGLNLVGQKPMALLRGEFGELLRDLLRSMRQSPGVRWERQLVLRRGNAERKLLVNVVALENSEGENAGMVAVFEDVTELERMQRTEAWREVAKRIAHEIKNPLTPIKLSAQRLERKFSKDVDDPVFGQCTELIVRQVEHLQQMVKEFSTFAKLPEVQPHTDYLAPLLEEVVALFKNSHSSIEWTLDFAGTIPEMQIDPEAIRRALINVLTNAAEALVEAGVENGRVAVSAEHDKRTGQVRVRIEDNGPGLGEVDGSRLFEPYYTRKKGGTGLGLTIVRSIIADHHGYVRAQTMAGGGLAMTIELPVNT